jgi:hypothetical protein
MGGEGSGGGVFRLVVRGVVLAALAAAPLRVVAAEPEPAPAASGTAVKRVPRVRMGQGYSAGVVRAALEGASRRLAEPRCQGVVSEFDDTEGRPLEDALERIGMAADDYLLNLLFYDGSGHKVCRIRYVLAFTAPGSRVVYVCPEQFRHEYDQNKRHAEVTIIHEMLHSLGLGENPPSHSYISGRVLANCRG